MSVKRVARRRLTDQEKGLARLFRKRVLVGIPASAGSQPGSTASLAVIGYVQEHGDDSRNIPARPFLEPGVRDAGPKLAGFLKEAAQAALRSDSAGADNALQKVGLTAQAAVKQKLADGSFVPLKPTTIYARQHRKEMPTTSTHPLIDTRALFNSINFVVGEKK